jgi:hypothetical protein
MPGLGLVQHHKIVAGALHFGEGNVHMGDYLRVLQGFMPISRVEPGARALQIPGAHDASLFEIAPNIRRTHTPERYRLVKAFNLGEGSF